MHVTSRMTRKAIRTPAKSAETFEQAAERQIDAILAYHVLSGASDISVAIGHAGVTYEGVFRPSYVLGEVFLWREWTVELSASLPNERVRAEVLCDLIASRIPRIRDHAYQRMRTGTTWRLSGPELKTVFPGHRKHEMDGRFVVASREDQIVARFANAATRHFGRAEADDLLKSGFIQPTY